MNDKEKEFVKNNAHIPDAEVLQDIADTEREIKEIEANPLAHPDSSFARLNGSPASRIAKRQKFISELQELIELRKKDRMNK